MGTSIKDIKTRDKFGWPALLAFVCCIPLFLSSCAYPVGKDENPSLTSTSTRIIHPATPKQGVVQQDPQLKLLYDYTIFHIGVYITLVTGILAALKYKTNQWCDLLYFPTLLFFILAGLCGGIVCSNIPNYVSLRVDNVLVDLGSRTKKLEMVQPFIEGKYRVSIFSENFLSFSESFSRWIMWEHLFFWCGIFWLVTVLILQVFKEARNNKNNSKKLKKIILQKDNSSILIVFSEAIDSEKS